MELLVLVAPQRLKPKKHLSKEESLGRSKQSCHLFSPEEHYSELRPSRYALPCYRHKEQVFLAGLLLMRVNINQINPRFAPLPQQIALYVASMVHPSFMKASYIKYDQTFWKTGDWVMITNSTHLGQHGNIVFIE